MQYNYHTYLPWVLSAIEQLQQLGLQFIVAIVAFWKRALNGPMLSQFWLDMLRSFGPNTLKIEVLR